MTATKHLHLSNPLLMELGEIARSYNVELFVVGGYVRDSLLGRDRTDIDCTVVGDALEFAQTVATHYGSKAVLYERFRTALVPIGDYHVEFVGTRKEEYDGLTRKPVVTEGTLLDDLRRRDFTINAMAATLTQNTSSEIIDLFHGQEDLALGILRTPLDPIVTFSDDPLRMMRAARFAAQLGFTIEEATLSAMQQMANRISIISQERITAELLKILASPKPSIGLSILYSTGVLAHFFPMLEQLAGVDLARENHKVYQHKDVFFHTLQVVDNVAANSTNVWLRFAALMHDIAKPKTKRFTPGFGWSFHGHDEVGARMQKGIFRSLKLPMEQQPYVENLVRLHHRPMALVDDGVTDSAVRRLAVAAGTALDDLFILVRADITTQNPERQRKYLGNYDIVQQKIIDVRERDTLAEFQSPVRGEEIMSRCEIGPSKAVGFIKEKIEEAILDGHVANTYEASLAYLLEHKDVWLSEAKELMAIRGKEKKA